MTENTPERVCITTNKNHVVKKHQELVRNARYNLGEQELKIISILISMISTEDTEFKEYTLSVKDFNVLIGSNSNNTHKNIVKANRALMSSPFIIEDSSTMYNWVSSAKHIRGEGIFSYTIHPELKKYLLHLKSKFLKYDISNILPLRSPYIIRLYEMCKDRLEEGTRYSNKDKGYDFHIDIDELKLLFGMPKSYKIGHIRERVFSKAYTQFKKFTDIRIEYQDGKKEGKTVKTILVSVFDNCETEITNKNMLENKTNFKTYMTNEFKELDILTAKDKDSGDIFLISINSDGFLYNKNNGTVFELNRADEIWDSLYSMGRNNTLACLKNEEISI